MDYIYDREIVNGKYNIENPLRVDEYGYQIRLAKEVEIDLPGIGFRLVCNGKEAKFIFEKALTTNQQTTLDNVVAAHKDNTW